MKLTAKALLTLVLGLLCPESGQAASGNSDGEFVILSPPMSRSTASDACMAHGWRLARVTNANLKHVSKTLRQAGVEYGWIESFDGSKPLKESSQALLLKSGNEYCRLDTIAAIPQGRTTLMEMLYPAICEIRSVKTHSSQGVEEKTISANHQRVKEARRRNQHNKKNSKEPALVFYDTSLSSFEEHMKHHHKHDHQLDDKEDFDQVIVIPKHAGRVFKQQDRKGKDGKRHGKHRRSTKDPKQRKSQINEGLLPDTIVNNQIGEINESVRNTALVEGKGCFPGRRCPVCCNPGRRRRRHRSRSSSSSSSSSSDPSSTTSITSSSSFSSSSTSSSRHHRRRGQKGRCPIKSRRLEGKTVEGKGSKSVRKTKAPPLDLDMLNKLVNQAPTPKNSPSSSNQSDEDRVIYVKRRNHDPRREGKNRKCRRKEPKEKKHKKKCKKVKPCKEVDLQPQHKHKSQRPLLPVRRRHRERSRSSSTETDTLSYSSFAEQVYASSSDGPAAIFRNRRLYRHLHRESSSSSSSSGSQEPILPGILGGGLGIGLATTSPGLAKTGGETGLLGSRLSDRLLDKTSKKLALVSKHIDMETLRAQRRAKSDMRRQERDQRLAERTRKRRTNKGSARQTLDTKGGNALDEKEVNRQVHFDDQTTTNNTNVNKSSVDPKPIIKPLDEEAPELHEQK